MWAKRSLLRRSIRSSYMYRVFRLIDSEPHITRENVIFVEFGQCLVWAFIDLPLQARNAPICAPGKKWETLPFSLPLRVPPFRKSGEKGHPREIRRRVVWFMAEVPRPLSSAEFREAATRPFLDPFSVAHSCVPFSSCISENSSSSFSPFFSFSPLTLHSITLLRGEKLQAVLRFDISGRPAWSISSNRAFRLRKLPPHDRIR